MLRGIFNYWFCFANSLRNSSNVAFCSSVKTWFRASSICEYPRSLPCVFRKKIMAVTLPFLIACIKAVSATSKRFSLMSVKASCISGNVLIYSCNVLRVVFSSFAVADRKP